MRATYVKLLNLIQVELTTKEAQQYLAVEISTKDRNLRSTDTGWELTIPCASTFYQMTQRRRGGPQPWDPDQLRQAIRAGVANRLIPWDQSMTGDEEFKTYRKAWAQVAKPLIRNVRLMFPSKAHPGPRLSHAEVKFKAKWRATHNVQ